MPKTCKEETIPDTAIIHPVFASQLLSISVLKDGWFDSHDPVLKLQMPGQQIFRLGYKLPCQPCFAPAGFRRSCI